MKMRYEIVFDSQEIESVVAGMKQMLRNIGQVTNTSETILTEDHICQIVETMLKNQFDDCATNRNADKHEIEFIIDNVDVSILSKMLELPAVAETAVIELLKEEE